MHEDRLISTQLNRMGYSDWREKGDMTAIAGSTASVWADPGVFNIIRNEILNNPSIEVVVLVIGGNDLLAGKFNNGWHAGMTSQEETVLFNKIENDIRTIINGIKDASPGISVVICGYDYLNFVHSIFDPGTWLMWDNLGQPTPAQINGAVIKLEQRKVNIANNDPDVYYVHNLGLMHRKYGYEGFFGANISPLPGNTPPNYSPFPGGFPEFPSSKNALGGDGSDPIHLNKAGYNEVVKNLINHFFLPFFKRDVNSTFTSQGQSADGFTKPGSKDNSQFRIGRDGSGFFRNVVSFNTASLPENAEIESASIFITRSCATLTSFPRPLDRMKLKLDVKKGFFGSLVALEPTDHTAPADAYDIGCFIGPVAGNGAKMRIDVDPSALQHINLSGTTQFRFYMDDNLSGNIYYAFYDGDANAAQKPVLEISYTLGDQREEGVVLPMIPVEKDKLVLFPNPARAGGYLYFDTDYFGEVTITDALGRYIMRDEVSEADNAIKLPASLPKGVYYATVSNATGNQSKAFKIAR